MRTFQATRQTIVQRTKFERGAAEEISRSEIQIRHGPALSRVRG